MTMLHVLGHLDETTNDAEWLTVWVQGKPEPGGSKKGFVHPHTGVVVVVDANAKVKPWKKAVAKAAAAIVGDAAPLDGPLELQVHFYVERPAGHYGTGRNASRLKPSAPGYPTSRPDATKLLRAVEDALTGVLWQDDAQIVRQTVTKNYGQAGAMVSVRRIQT